MGQTALEFFSKWRRSLFDKWISFSLLDMNFLYQLLEVLHFETAFSLCSLVVVVGLEVVAVFLKECE